MIFDIAQSLVWSSLSHILYQFCQVGWLLLQLVENKIMKYVTYYISHCNQAFSFSLHLAHFLCPDKRKLKAQVLSEYALAEIFLVKDCYRISFFRTLFPPFVNPFSSFCPFFDQISRYKKHFFLTTNSHFSMFWLNENQQN